MILGYFSYLMYVQSLIPSNRLVLSPTMGENDSDTINLFSPLPLEIKNRKYASVSVTHVTKDESRSDFRRNFVLLLQSGYFLYCASTFQRETSVFVSKLYRVEKFSPLPRGPIDEPFFLYR